MDARRALQTRAFLDARATTDRPTDRPKTWAYRVMDPTPAAPVGVFARCVVPRLVDARAHQPWFRRYKGDAGGRIAVIGGSNVYSGAPWFAAKAAMECGGDLVHVYTSTSCARVIKGYSGDCVTHALWNDDEDEEEEEEEDDEKGYTRAVDGETERRTMRYLNASGFARMRAKVYGPGLGRGRRPMGNPLVRLGETPGPTVIDADGILDLIELRRRSDSARGVPILPGYESSMFPCGHCIATPNKMELFRLLAAVDESFTSIACLDLNSDAGIERVGISLYEYYPVQFLVKGEVDILFMHGSNFAGMRAIKIDYKGAPKRCGGQGDILAGVLGVFLSWTSLQAVAERRKVRGHEKALDADLNNSDEIQSEQLFLSAIHAACFLTRTAARAAYAQRGRATQASDILSHIAPIFRQYLDPDFVDPLRFSGDDAA
jgi:NAD(P)H-hydrate repair Nnr-like enzyme with NAD(P)H-hydrate dehydratase domain